MPSVVLVCTDYFKFSHNHGKQRSAFFDKRGNKVQDDYIALPQVTQDDRDAPLLSLDVNPQMSLQRLSTAFPH